MTPARFRWGLFLVLLGLLLLLRNFGVLNDNFWLDLLILFPVVLIMVGLEKIFARTRLSIISYLTSVALFVGGLAIAFTSSRGGDSTSFFSTATYVKDADSAVRFTRAVLDLDESDLTIRDSGDDLVYAKFDKFTRKPRIDFREEDSLAVVEFASRPHGLLGGAIKIETDEAPDWFVRFKRDVPLEMRLAGVKSDMHLNMSTTPLRALDLSADQSSVYLKIGDLEPFVKVSVFGEDTELRLRVPRTVGLRVLAGEEYKAYLYSLGLITRDDAWVNEGFDTLPNKIEVKLDDRLQSVSVDFF
ncbi:MAG TPA: DUF5668 domain-containing protein [candidate division Zixibacteria bacterium]|nr:hypothetical protein [candidate division Zixibacteria bacterium]MDD4916302.1 DUF5668 domain-containing protein [candidate division Zixibacteria bacterium]MDM7973683.1 DUF5668 domain-containing protein [candidate division Zixibacteria bacterium]HOD65717.1 DUF5668 domain-containing protein [candidate division Zixibacteria bacterium]HPC10962.1 DUF5668 domain-containing protein [candidate division Zixibacteria bacterium]